MSEQDTIGLLPLRSDYSMGVKEASMLSPRVSINRFDCQAFRIAYAAMWGGQRDGFYEAVQRLNAKIISRAVFHVRDIEGLLAYMKRHHKGGIWYWTCYLNRTEYFQTSDGRPVPPFFVKDNGERVTPGRNNLVGFVGVTLSMGEYSSVYDYFPADCLERGWHFVRRLQFSDLKAASLVCSPSDSEWIKGESRGLSCTLVFDSLLTDPFVWYLTAQMINQIHDCHRTNLNWSLYVPIGGTPEVNLHPVPGTVFSYQEAQEIIQTAVFFTDPGHDWGYE